MPKKFFWVGIFILIFLIFTFFVGTFFLYSKEISNSIEVKYYLPQETVKNPFGKIEFVLKYPISKSYFLKNISFYPKTKGNFYFENEIVYLSKIKGYKKIIFVPEELERDKPYKIKVFQKEFTFSLPSPKTKLVLYDKKEKKLEIEFFEPVEEDYFFKNFQLKPKPRGKYIFLDKNKKVIFIPGETENDVEYRGKILDREVSFKIEVPKVSDIYFDRQKKEVVATITEPVKEDKVFNSFEISPAVKYAISFNENHTKVFIKFDELKEDVYYKLKILKKEFTFIYPSVKVTNIYFDKNKKQVVVVFNIPVEEEKILKEFKIEPEVNGKFIFSQDKTWFIFQPQKLEIERWYKVIILGAKLSFKLQKPSPPINSASKNRYIDINLSTQTLRLYQDGKVVATYRISSGRPGMETPTGTFRVLSKHPLLWSSQYGLYMPYSLRFYNGYFIHELPYWPGGYREGENHLGIPVSHGCVRLGVGAAKVVYEFADIGTKVIIHY